ncbi:sugar ABC transporter ATP-binding protein [Oricola sp.]|uniref:sugar ABC transporter ATP-binding protein n=1 Tax=Oricola sp. TaxID=1979950 RepID=UPI003BA93154
MADLNDMSRDLPVLEGRGLTKSYAGVTVAKDIDVSVHAGRIRAVIGENGAGKSTLMKMLAGIVHPNSGKILIDGVEVTLSAPREAIRRGVAIVHQELHHVPMLSLADNIMIERPSAAPRGRRGSRVELGFAAKYLRRVGLDVDPRVRAGDLSAAEAQLLEIAKALALEPKAIIFDEPTAALPPSDVRRLLDLIGDLRRSGLAILYISHHLSEVLELADDISVLRDGALVADLANDGVGEDELIRAMVGRSVSLYDLTPPAHGSGSVLKVSGAAGPGVRGLEFELREGEILGFAGLIGSGMHDAAQLLCGDKRLVSGTISIRGSSLKPNSPSEAARNGVTVVPEERKTQGIVPSMSVVDNLHLGRYRRYSSRGLLSPRRMRDGAAELIRKFRVRVASQAQPISTLSGGNQQKVVVARAVQAEPDVLVLSEPTRGVDVGAKDEIHQLLFERAASGVAIIVVSSEMDEVLALAHRVAVFSAGKMTGLLDRCEATPERVMALASPTRAENAA